MKSLVRLREWISRSPLRLYFVFFLLAVLPISLFFFSSRRVLRRQTESQALENSLQAARLSAILVQEHFQQSAALLASYASRYRLRESWERRDLKEVLRHLEQAHKLRPDCAFFSVYDTDGTMRAIHPPEPSVVNRNFAFRDWYRGVSKNWTPYVSEVYRTAVAPYPLVVAVAVPIRDEQDKVTGILMAPHRLDTISGWLRQVQGSGSLRVSVVDQNGQLLAHPGIDPHRPAVKVSGFEAVRRARAGQSGAGVFWRGSEELAVAYVPVPAFNWVVLAEQPAENLRQGVRAVERQVWWLAAVFAALALGCGGLLGRLYRQLVEVQNELKALNEGLEDNVRQRTSALTAEIAERQRTEAALRSSEERYRELFENANDLVYTHDLAGRFTSLNKACEQTLGYSREAALGMNVRDLLAPEYRELAQQMLERKLAGEAQTAYEVEIIHKGGRRVALEVSTRLMHRDGAPAGVQVIARDVTQRKNLERQLLQAQKMEAVGRLAGGIAHDFNNLLTVILGYSDQLLEHQSTGPAIARAAQEITCAADRAAMLTRQLLAFSRQQVLHPQVLDLNSAVGNADKLLRRLIGEDIELVTLAAPDLGNVKADPGQLEQVIMNLAVNARDAMPRGGKLTIQTANMELDQEYAQAHLGVPPGRYVLLTVSDTGCGMDAETQAHMFEPFFTTKEPGRGTGLGLATTYGIIRQSGGSIWVYSEPGQGTTFKVYLPCVEEEAPVALPGAAAPLRRGSETVLLVEDEQALRELITETLHRNGYTVLAAADAAEAVRTWQSHSGPIHLLLTDVVLPGCSGRELAEELLGRLPNLKVLYMSGYTDDAIVRHGVLAAGIPFLQKPFTAGTLARKVREVLDGVAGGLGSEPL